MQLSLPIVASGVALALASAQPTPAACALVALGASGALGDPTQDYTVMSSEAGGRSASFTAAVTLGSSTVTIDAPSVVYTGPHPHSGDQPQIKYRATDLLGLLDRQQAYTNQATSFTVTSLLGVVTTVVDGKITNPTGFAQGNYQLRTVVTCS